MTRYIIRRLIAVVALLAAVLVVTFVIFFAIGSNPALRLCGKICTPTKLASIEHVIGTDVSKPQQFVNYTKGIFVGRTFGDGDQTFRCNAPCLGISFKTNQPVLGLIWDRFGTTFAVAIGAAVLWLLLGVTTGVVAALRQGSSIDKGIVGFATVGLSIPVQLVGYLLLYLICIKGKVAFPHYVNFRDNPLEWARGLIMPWVTLAFIYSSVYTRLTRTQMVEAMQEDYIRTARGKGLGERAVAYKHGLRAALPPLIVVFGLDLGALLGGAIITERIFGLTGLGNLFTTSVSFLDLPVIVGVSLFGAFFILIANLVVDVLYASTDPKVTLS
jgi:peptide/nickel transport system permease protein